MGAEGVTDSIESNISVTLKIYSAKEILKTLGYHFYILHWFHCHRSPSGKVKISQMLPARPLLEVSTSITSQVDLQALPTTIQNLELTSIVASHLADHS